jgi:hypothetical protein
LLDQIRGSEASLPPYRDRTGSLSTTKDQTVTVAAASATFASSFGGPEYTALRRREARKQDHLDHPKHP